MKMQIDANKVIELLVASYRERLEDDGDLVADELALNWPNQIERVEYDPAKDVINFNPYDDGLETLPDDFVDHAKCL
jgi:hypothetical protein